MQSYVYPMVQLTQIKVVTCISVHMAAACILSNNSWNYNNKITADFVSKNEKPVQTQINFYINVTGAT